MNRNIDKAFETIFNDVKLTEGLVHQDTPEKLYEFCTSIHGGYTKEQFDEYIKGIMSGDQEEDFDLKLNEDDLKNISGGSIKTTYNKLMATALASLAFMTPTAMPASYAAGETIAERRGSIMQPVATMSKKSFWERNKQKIIKLGLAVLAISGTAWWYKHNHPDTPVNNPASGLKGDGAPLEDPETTVRNAYSSFVDKARGNWPMLGKAMLVPAGLYVLAEKLGKFSERFNQTTGAYYNAQRIIESYASWRKYKENVSKNRPVELRQSIDNIDNLFAEIKGQEKAKKEVRRLIINILHKKKNAELRGIKYSKGDVLYFYGPSRVGKSLMAEGLARHKILSTSEEPYCVSASEVDKDSGKDTVLDQLFGMSSYGGYGGYDEYGGYFGRGGAMNATKPKNLVKYINENPNGVIVIDEYDKMHSPQLDEVFRTIVDKGTVTVKGQTIDCSGMTFILTSNECKASIEGGNQYKGTDYDDGTGSRTFIKHDKSFLNRIKPVEFENLASRSYEEIIRKETKEDIIDYWALPEIAGLDVVITDNAYKSMAKSVEKKNEGASHAHTLIAALLSDITTEVANKEGEQKDYYRGKKLFVDFNSDDDTFTLREAPGSSDKNKQDPDKPQKEESPKENKDNSKIDETSDVKEDASDPDVNTEKHEADKEAAVDEKNEHDDLNKDELKSGAGDASVQKENDEPKQGTPELKDAEPTPVEISKKVELKNKDQDSSKKLVTKKHRKIKNTQIKNKNVKPTGKK